MRVDIYFQPVLGTTSYKTFYVDASEENLMLEPMDECIRLKGKQEQYLIPLRNVRWIQVWKEEDKTGKITDKTVVIGRK